MNAATLVLDPIVLTAARVVLALLFATTAAHKLADTRSFRDSVRAYRLLPDSTVGAIATLLTATEAALVIALLIPALARAAAVAAAALLTLYTIAIAINLARGRSDLDCGCAGPASRQPLNRGLLWRNGLLIAVALLASAPAAERTLVWIDTVSLLGSVACAAALWHAAGRLLSVRAAVASEGAQ